MQMKRLDRKPEALPPSRLGPDGKFKGEGQEEQRHRLGSTHQRLREIAELPNESDDSPDEEWMRGIDEMRPHRPLFEGCY
jgi:hypothetical protein